MAQQSFCHKQSTLPRELRPVLLTAEPPSCPPSGYPGVLLNKLEEEALPSFDGLRTGNVSYSG